VAKNNPILCSFKSTSSKLTKDGYYTNARYNLGGNEAPNRHRFQGGQLVIALPSSATIVSMVPSLM
ncbi:MAG TPA: hypothetical protein DD457_10080, partial [Gammaproteobacteria bacterium]|nr:hypothetical protein [Gammaproteobacteria bacterium]